MRTVIIAAAVALAACGAPATSETPATEAAPVAQPTAAEPATPAATLTAETLVGRWGDNGDCTKDIVFASDGTYRSYTGGSGRWSVNGDIITMSGAGGTFQVRAEILNGNQLLIGNPDGSIGISQRC